MNILGLIASGRKLGNSEILVKEMLNTLTGEKRLLRLSDLDIKPCHACYACLPKGKACIIEDDFDFFLKQLEWADVVVLASPCYFLGEHNSIKLITDRLISILNERERFQGKRCVAAVTYGVSQWQGYAREAIMNFIRFLHLDLAGSMMVNAANPGEVVKSETLREAHNLVKKLFKKPNHRQEKETIFCPGCHSSLLQITHTGNVRCVMCGMTGKMISSHGHMEIHTYDLEHYRYSAEGMKEHAERLENIKNEYMNKRKELSMVRKAYKEQDKWWVYPSKEY